MENEDRQYIWKAACCASVLMAVLGILLMGFSFIGKMKAAKYMNVFDAYDDCALLMVLTIFGIICCLAGIYGAVVSHLSTNKKKLKRIQFMVYVYIGWGAALAVLCFVVYSLVLSCSSSLDMLLRTGFFEKMLLYNSDDSVRDTIDAMQRDLGCCGNFNLTDWFTVNWSLNISKTDNAIPESCCDRESLEGNSLKSCILAVPFGEATRLTSFPVGCVLRFEKYFGSILNTRSLMVIGCGILQSLVTGLVVFEVLKARHIYKTQDRKPEQEEQQTLIDKSRKIKESATSLSDSRKKSKHLNSASRSSINE